MHIMKRIRATIFLPLWLILGCWNEHIALFQENNPTPISIFPYRVEAFPLPDQSALKTGIPIANDEHLQRLLQDFLS